MGKQAYPYVQIRYTCCSIRICFSLRVMADSFRSSSIYGGSAFCSCMASLVGRLETTLTFQNFQSLQRKLFLGWDEGEETNLVYHVTFRVPALVPHVSVDLDELFQDRGAASGALGRKPRRIVVMAIDIPVVLVVRVMRPKQGRAYRASEVLHVILLVWKKSSSVRGTTTAWTRSGPTAGGDITSPQGHTTFGTDEVQTSEVIPLAQWMLISIRALDREELRGHHVPTILGQGQKGGKCGTLYIPCT